MRILAVGSMYPPHHLGGYEVVWQGAMRHARDAGHQVRVLASDHAEPGAGPEQDPDVHRTLEWYWSWQDYEWRRLSPLDRLRLERRNAAQLQQHLREFRPDVVTWWPMGGMSLSLIDRARRADNPSVLVVHDDWLVYGPQVDAWMRLWSRWRRFLAPPASQLTGLATSFELGSDRILFNSRFMQRRAKQNGVPLNNAAVVSPGIDGRFQNAPPVREWRWQLLCVGRLDPQKGQDTAIEALEALPPETTLTIAGTGDPAYIQRLHAQATRLGAAERVEFIGSVDRDSMPQLISEADVVVFPVRWEEPWGLVPLEAMGIGRPVVATARGGSAEFLLDGENALVFEVDQSRQLAACVRRLGDDPALRRRLRQAGLATAANHTAEAFERRIVEEIEAASRGNRSRG